MSMNGLARIVLNSSVGGINPQAVEGMHRMSGGRGKVVWLPTFRCRRACQDARGSEQVRPGGGPNGQVTAPMEEILKMIARENLILAIGHVHAEEGVAVRRRARELGVKNIVVTHGLTNIPGLSMAQAKEVAAMGAMIEICDLQFMTGSRCTNRLDEALEPGRDRAGRCRRERDRR